MTSQEFISMQISSDFLKVIDLCNRIHIPNFSGYSFNENKRRVELRYREKSEIQMIWLESANERRK